MTWPWKKKAAPLCVECRWVRDRGIVGYACGHPLHVYLVTGDALVSCDERRGNKFGKCGPSGKLFEPKEK